MEKMRIHCLQDSQNEFSFRLFQTIAPWLESMCAPPQIFLFIQVVEKYFFNFILWVFFWYSRVEGIECLATSPLWLLKGFSNLFLFPSSSSSSSYLSYFFDFSPVNNLWCFKILFFFSFLNFFYIFLLFSGWSLFFYDKCSNLMFFIFCV